MTVCADKLGTLYIEMALQPGEMLQINHLLLSNVIQSIINPSLPLSSPYFFTHPPWSYFSCQHKSNSWRTSPSSSVVEYSINMLFNPGPWKFENKQQPCDQNRKRTPEFRRTQNLAAKDLWRFSSFLQCVSIPASGDLEHRTKIVQCALCPLLEMTFHQEKGSAQPNMGRIM